MASAAASASAAGARERSGGLTGPRLLLAGFVLALTNFMVVLDTTIANVSVPHISGGLGVSVTQGTWVVTSYAVAEAICVPLTGWLVKRFGTVRTFMFALAGFTMFSALCGLATSLGMIVAFRIGQGLCGGPLMPLTQTLLLRIFPKEQHAQAMGVWAMTTVTAPIIGPIAGGWISDNWSWPWIFFINLPIGIACLFGVFTLLRGAETKTETSRIDRVGLILMVTWIAALQVMLDLGRERDWFGSTFIVGCAIVAVVGFAAFIIWELTEEQPVVDLRVFRHRGFAVAVAALALAFGTFFASVVVIPQWLQGSLNYTATESGRVTAFTGILAVILSPIVAKFSTKVDSRALVCFGMAWLGVVSVTRALWWSSGADFWTLAIPQLMQGLGMPFFFIPLTTIALAAVRPEETASAAGVMSFLRTLAAAIGTSIAATKWEEHGRIERNEIVNTLNQPDQVVTTLQTAGLSAEQGRGMIERLVDQESIALATNHIFLVAAVIFFLSATLIWFAPRPKGAPPPGAAH
ncbi:DHA2 family efflux MFS transporter permease subunit [Sphingomonas naphthae]|uniref:DHA2 family efflux MFS transporter permease subunit n=1 Tax=Sphingomonas naphthae TaxID=1813468 RepID=A0ABY7TNQ8_9SPHN|nr:DHA2 family efflux MFS transporter permease subunit [Sphingomonas naphthae]WCT74336.1 DHA2 family efflux MFS transporter permease subunit [Sphingomonas naphthae]